ncbi:hypothetical protein TRFO_17083 [Tritrichomonas foetus]|uniref:Uncharacterized protein n=1 Tax=Tritrichomonas foetus TaxID=1144522 RepID=A0A1J4KTW6_9EUKA|nr:hypothetical protein TRFO_17083 [Tritrichomonas foetus]|eukprot:OHT12925.1 hypothetical protein TRFO_17083 [Tritrichomonas foetus]
MDEADKFIASLKFPTKKKNSKKDKLEKTDILYKSSITPEDIILFKTESEKLKALMQEESIIDMESDEDLLI